MDAVYWPHLSALVDMSVAEVMALEQDVLAQCVGYAEGMNIAKAMLARVGARNG
jgi:hypothetical protein